MKNNFYILKVFLVVCILAECFSVAYAEDSVVVIPDITPPTLTLIGEALVHVSENTLYIDQGATAFDETDGDISARISIENLVNTEIPGDYTVTYTVSDVAGNSATSTTRMVVVDSTEVPVALTATFIIRSGDTVLFNGSVSLPETGSVSILDQNKISHDVNSRSIFALLSSIDEITDTFSISDSQYYDSFGSFYLKCIQIKDGSKDCDNWQYVVGATMPITSIDKTILSGGETVGLYFGSTHRLRFNTTTITQGESLSVTAESYNYVTNSWEPLVSDSVGITVPNSEDPWSPTVISTCQLSPDGTASVLIDNPGVYTAGLVNDYFFPAYTVTVQPMVVTGGGGNVTTQLPKFDVPGAINYLKRVQSPDGSFGDSDMYTDWVAIAYGAFNVSDDSRDLLLAYLKQHTIISSVLTDNERRTMALLALGQNPYSFNGINYIDTIIQSFDGVQFGDPNLINDDIFALIPIFAAGYTIEDESVTKDIQFIISKQMADGSWEGSVDLTAAAMQALTSFSGIIGVSDSLSKAKEYIASTQEGNGGWNSIYTTSWVLQAGSITNTLWIKNDHNGIDFLTLNQSSDGAVLSSNETIQNRIWATSYAIPAVLSKPWDAILRSVSKPIKEAVSPSINAPVENEQGVSSKTEIVSKLSDSTKDVETSIISIQEKKISVITLDMPIKKVTVPLIIKEPTSVVSEQDYIDLKTLTASAAQSVTGIPEVLIVVASIVTVVLVFAYRFITFK